MANPEHVDILNQGVEVWNRWREERKEQEEPARFHGTWKIEWPDLADLSGINLENRDLHGVNFEGVNLEGTKSLVQIFAMLSLRMHGCMVHSVVWPIWNVRICDMPI